MSSTMVQTRGSSASTGSLRRSCHEMAPPAWRPSIVHLGPIAHECADDLVDAFGDAFVGLTAQGWLREWDEDGRISRCEWDEPERDSRTGGRGRAQRDGRGRR